MQQNAQSSVENKSDHSVSRNASRCQLGSLKTIDLNQSHILTNSEKLSNSSGEKSQRDLQPFRPSGSEDCSGNQTNTNISSLTVKKIDSGKPKGSRRL